MEVKIPIKVSIIKLPCARQGCPGFFVFKEEEKKIVTMQRERYSPLPFLHQCSECKMETHLALQYPRINYEECDGEKS